MISTHAPLARRDENGNRPEIFISISTHAPLARRDGVSHSGSVSKVLISTHAPLARRDYGADLRGANLYDFYSRASCEARHLYIALYGVYYFISTHAPLARRDANTANLELLQTQFLLTRLLRGATRR